MKNTTLKVKIAMAMNPVKYLDSLAARFGVRDELHLFSTDDVFISSRRPYSPSPLCPPMAQVFGRTVINRVK